MHSERFSVSLDFLAHTSAVLVNLAPNEQGVVSIPRQELGPHQHLHIVAVDPRSTAYRSVSLPEAKATFVDLRLAVGLDPKQHFAQQKQITVVDAKQPFTVADITSARLEAYDSLATVYSLYVTLSKDPTLVEFGFLMNWPNLKPEQKRAQYSKYACHELSFFLYHKDPEFFRAVVQPHLKNKKDKQFLDHWLLGDDLTAFAQPWNYAQLNAVERILLSQRVAADRPHTVRDTADRFALIPPDVERFNRLFETALKGRALDTSDRRRTDADGDPFLNLVEKAAAVTEQKFRADAATALKDIRKKVSTDPAGAERELKLLLETLERNTDIRDKEKSELREQLQAAIREAGRVRIDVEARLALVRENQAAVEERRLAPEVEKRLAELVEKFNELIDQKRFAEAEVLAKQAAELAPESAVARSMKLTARLAFRMDQAEAGKEEGVYRALTTVDESSIPAEGKAWADMTLRRKEYASADLAKRKAGDKVEEFLEKDAEARATTRQFFRTLDRTQEWAENNYYHLPKDRHNTELITVNAFWRDYAQFDAGRGRESFSAPRPPTAPDRSPNKTPDPLTPPGFRSAHFAEASHNLPEMLLALAVLDLPFAAEKHEMKFNQTQMTLTPGSPLILFHEEIKPIPAAKEPSPILVSQAFFRHGERTQQVNNEQVDKFVTEEFLVGVVYGCAVVVTNPTSSKQKLDVLLQIPRGAIPVLKGRETRSVHIDLEPYHTQTLEYHFYFPAPGEFAHYPVHVSKNVGKGDRSNLCAAPSGPFRQIGPVPFSDVVAAAPAVTLKAVAKLSRLDTSSWEYLSQFGTNEDVLKYLKQNNLHRTNLDKIAFRMQDKALFEAATALLARRHVYSDTLWSYALKHNAPAAAREYLQHADEFVGQCGSFLDSPLLTIDPVARRAYQHLDYRPLVNARAHPLGSRRQIVNERFHAQYHQLLKILSYRRDLDDAELMAVTYYLLLQDRIEEALGTFGRVRPERLDTRLQYDYFAAYLAMIRQQPQEARALADKYAAYPVDRWRDLFAALRAQVDEIDSARRGSPDPAETPDRQVSPASRRPSVGEVARSGDRPQLETHTKLAATEASFDFQVEAKKVTLNYQNLKQVRVNYYLMDIELLFSRNPFVQQYSGQFANIRPNLTQTVELPPQQAAITFELPKPLHRSHVLVEITGAGQTKSRAYYANALAVQVLENYGQLHVKYTETGKPLPKVYVKVYAQTPDGTVKFYKDGYTDLRGRFDYTSLSTNELDFVKKFSLLVLSEDHGAAVREANPPQR